jgi:glycosyltransferase involved in cell wall biosynthesis
MGKNAREKVLKEFNADIIAKQYVELYERVIT